jgi:hypothetical protein
MSKKNINLNRMKIKIIIGLLIIGLVTMSFTLIIDKSNATVEEQNGIKIFCYSEPTTKYDILGMVKISGIVKNEKGPHMVELLVGYAKKDYPSGEGIIVNSEFEKAEVIKFKE